MIIKIADERDDCPDLIVDLLMKAHEESPYAIIPLDRNLLYQLVINFAKGEVQNHVFLLLQDDMGLPRGVLFGVVSESHPIFFGHKITSELLWYVEEEFRHSKWSIKLLKAYEEWAKYIGAEYISVAHFNNTIGDRVSKLYTRLGYEPCEKAYIKKVI